MKQEMTFEEAKDAIEAILQDLEQGSLPLEESVAKFEEAAKLVKFCQKKLDSYQKKIEAITLETEQEDE